VIAAIVLWNTAYLERVVAALRRCGKAIPDELLAHLSSLGWEHINLTSDYVWNPRNNPKKGQFRPLQAIPGNTP
jgi:hypothetical protein